MYFKSYNGGTPYGNVSMTNLSQISSKATRNIYKTGTSKTTRREKSIDELKKCLQQQIEELEMSVDGKIKLKDEHIEMTNLNKAKDKATKKKTKKINKNSKQKLSSRANRRSSYSPPHKKLNRRKSLKKYSKINKSNALNKSTANLHAKSSKYKHITKLKYTGKRLSKSAGKFKPKLHKRSKSKQGKRKKALRYNPMIGLIYLKAALVIQKYWRQYKAAKMTKTQSK